MPFEDFKAMVLSITSKAGYDPSEVKFSVRCTADEDFQAECGGILFAVNSDKYKMTIRSAE